MALGLYRIVPLTVAAALFMEHVDSTVISTSLPVMAHDLGVAPVTLNLAITSYLVSMAVFIPASGWLADRFGARRVFILAIATFLAGSIACGMAGNLGVLILGRLVQGMGGAMMTPVGRLVMLRTVPKSELISAMAWLSTPALVGPVLGPPLGGFITTYASWRWIFWINVPVGILGIVMALAFLPKIREEGVPPFDVLGFLLSACGLSALVFGMETIGRDIVPMPLTIIAACLGAALLGMYVRHARSVDQPLVDLRLMRIATFRISIVGGYIFRLGVGAIPFLLPLQLQIGFGRSAMESGLTTFISAAGALMLKPVAKRLISTFGFRNILVANTLIGGAMIVMVAGANASTPLWILMSVLFISGFFRSLEFTTINAMSYADVEQKMMSRATSFSSMAQQLSLSSGVAIAALILHLIAPADGSSLDAHHISIALACVGVASMMAFIPFLGVKKDAGAQMIAQEAAD